MNIQRRRNSILTLSIILLFFSCEKNNNIEFKGIDYIAYNYIDSFKKNKNIVKRDFLLHINKDSVRYSGLNIYRLNMWSELLDSLNPIPNKLSIYEGYKIAFFTKNVSNKDQITFKNNDIKLEDFYKKSSSNYLSNYPEWVVINRGNNQLIVKDMWYYPIDSIIKRHKKEIEKWDN